MQIAFRKYRQGGLFDHIIGWVTGGPYSHAELIFSDGTMFSSELGQGVRYRTKPLEPGVWHIINLDITPTAEKKMRVFCDSQLGKKYDVMGVLGFVLPAREEKGKWFCTEIIVRALQAAGRYWWVIPSRVHPSSLYRLLISQDVPPTWDQ